MIQDIGSHRLANEYCPNAVPAADDVLIYVQGRELAVRRVDGDVPSFEFPCVGDLADARAAGATDTAEGLPDGATTDAAGSTADDATADTLTYLFSLDNRAYWLAPDAGAAEPPAGYELADVHDLRAERRGPRELLYVAFTAIHLAHWYTTTRYCGACGQAMRHHETLRAMACPACGNLVFPRLNPAAIVCVRDPARDKIVITRYAAGVYQPIDALVAGFVEIGETIEDCVRREVREELGLEVDNISYYKSQPWGVAGDILSGYWCDVVGDPTLHRDPTELGSARWAGPEEIPGQPDDLSLTNEMMCLWRDQHRA